MAVRFDSAEDLVVWIANALESGKPRHYIQETLVTAGIAESQAKDLVRSIYRKIQKEKIKSDLVKGSIILGAALLITGVSYALAAPGGTYVIGWGAMLIGGLYILQGLLRFIPLLLG